MMLAFAAVLVSLLPLLPGGQTPQRAVVLTFDDLPAVTVAHDTDQWESITHALLDSLTRHRIPAIGFVNEGKLYRGESPDPARVALVRQWLAAGIELGNHTWSHLDLHRTTLEEYEADLLRGGTITRGLAGDNPKSGRFFRHPYLHTGRDSGTRRSLSAFLDAHGYRVAPVTIDNSDYVFAAAFDRAVLRGDGALVGRIAATYLDYMRRVVTYYEDQSMALFRREIPQVLLLHANALNALALDQLVAMLQRRGYAFVSLETALADDAYDSPDEYYGPGGITWLHRWALTRGEKGAFFAGEPTVPEWIEAASHEPVSPEGGP